MVKKKASSQPDPSQSASRVPKKIVVYSGSDPRLEHRSLFYLNLFWAVMTIGRQLGHEMISVIDTRSENTRLLRPPEISKLIEAGEIDGIIGFMMFDSMTQWMQKSGVPFAVMVGKSGPCRVELDYIGMIRDSFTRLSDLGCRSVGLMIPSMIANSAVLESMDETADALGLTVNYEWILVSRTTQELNGYNQFCSLFELKKRPDGLVIFPDVTARGVVSAIVERKVRVPEELKLVLHRNAEAPYTVPMACDWVEVHADSLANAFFHVLEQQWAGEKLEPVIVSFRLVKGNVLLNPSTFHLIK